MMEARFKTGCADCDYDIEVGEAIVQGENGWKHKVCPEDESPNVDDRPRCWRCGDVLTPDFECSNCEEKV